jgi:hypothetical protein
MNLFVQKIGGNWHHDDKVLSGCQGIIEPDLFTLLNKSQFLDVIVLQMYWQVDKKSNYYLKFCKFYHLCKNFKLLQQYKN